MNILCVQFVLQFGKCGNIFFKIGSGLFFVGKSIGEIGRMIFEFYFFAFDGQKFFGFHSVLVMKYTNITNLMKLLTLFIATLFTSAVFAQPKLEPTRISLKNGKTFTLNLAEGWEMIPALEGLKRVRFFAKAPDGRIFVTDMYNLADGSRGTVYILDGWNGKTGKFTRAIPYMQNLRNPNSVQFYRDSNGQEWFYLAETHQLTRRKFTRGETKPTDTRPQVLATFPDYGLSYKYGGWHLTRTISFSPDNKLYVSVGSSCNACVEKEKIRASIISMNPDGTDQKEFARGLRNAVGLRAIGKFVFATNQGSDHLGLQSRTRHFTR